jgi:hypothetical protein
MTGIHNLKKKFYLRTDFGLLQICIISTLNNTLHDLALIKMYITCFMGTEVSQLDILMVIQNKHMAN